MTPLSTDNCYAVNTRPHPEVFGTENKKPVPVNCWDRTNTILRCHPAWRKSAHLRILKICRPFSTESLAPSHLLKHKQKKPYIYSARPRKPIQPHVFRRNHTACDSLWKKWWSLLALPHRFIVLYHFLSLLSIEFSKLNLFFNNGLNIDNPIPKWYN